MAKKVLRTYFLNVISNDTNGLASKEEIESLFKVISSMPLKKNQDNSRVSETQSGTYYMVLSCDDRNIPAYKDCITGLFVKDRHFNYPYESNGSCELSKLILKDEDNTIAEMTYFLIYPQLSVALWVSNRYVAGYNRFKDYINGLINYQNEARETEIDLHAILNNDALENLKNAEEIRNIIFKTSLPVNQMFDDEDGNILSKMNRLIESDIPSSVKGYEIRISIKPDLQRTTIDNLKDVIKDLFGKRISFDKARARVVIDDSVEEIDFIDDQLVITEKLDLTGKYTDYKIIFDELHEQLNAKKQLILDKYRL